MALIEWSARLSAGFQEIDNQHRKLIGLVNRVNDEMGAGHGRQVLVATLQELIEYTAYHFDTEEQLMRQHGYEDTAEHKAEHARLIGDIGDFKRRVDSANSRVSIELLRFLRNWLNPHILGPDKEFAKALDTCTSMGRC